MKNKLELIIWDFDGVIADSEKIWLLNRQKFFNDNLGVNWDFDTINKYFGGMSDKTKKDVLEKLGYPTDDKFWKDVLNIDVEYMKKFGIPIMNGVENILIDKSIKQCVATGGTRYKTKFKTDIVKLNRFIPDNCVFTIDDVQKGKPEPDLFLFAAQQMKTNPKNCLVIEDSLAGMTAALRANMNVVAFLGSDIYQNQNYLDKVMSLGITNIFYNMEDLYNFIKINI